MIENFRDISQFNKLMRKGFIFRSSEYSIENNFQLLNEFNIDTIIDLRTKGEIKKSDYKKLLKNGIHYFNVPINLEFAKTVYSGTPMESAYQYFALNCKSEIAETLKIILHAKQSVLIHCRQGMDRTGMVIALLHLICNTDSENIKKDYMKSGSTIVEKHLDIFLSEIEKYEGVEKYLFNCLSSEEIQLLKDKLLQS